MDANNLLRAAVSLGKRFWFAGRVKLSHRRMYVALLLILLLLLILFGLASEMKLFQAVTIREDVLTSRASSLWQSFQTGFIRGLKQMGIVLPVSALLCFLVVALAGVFRRLFRSLYARQSIVKVLSGRRNAVILLSIFLLIFVLVPIVILVPYDVSLSVGEFAARYILELFTSMMLVALIVGGWRLLVTEKSLNDALVALDQEETSEAEVEEVAQVQSLNKWIKQGDITGWYELWEKVHFGNGLRPAVKTRLEYLRQAHPEKLTRLLLLLS